ncbi:winged helix-turn-helix transcriptional regulator [Actinosynnema sp. CS-041913]|uniref:winged helix-turn-helix transcriptional regulator n=1 Tax=Actinosynnema sp. CS-041913 TaxID=3239917 RepID=UPI003D8B73FB
MLGKTYENQNCSVARALEIVGERWSLLIMRNAMFRGTTKFTDFQRDLGIAPNVLTSRLETFVAAGLMYTDHREYRLTEKGLGLQPALIALTEWGDRWAAPDGPPIVYEHEDCGGRVHQRIGCTTCDAVPAPESVKARPGPGKRRTPPPPPA